MKTTYRRSIWLIAALVVMGSSLAHAGQQAVAPELGKLQEAQAEIARLRLANTLQSCETALTKMEASFHRFEVVDKKFWEAQQESTHGMANLIRSGRTGTNAVIALGGMEQSREVVHQTRNVFRGQIAAYGHYHNELRKKLQQLDQELKSGAQPEGLVAQAQELRVEINIVSRQTDALVAQAGQWIGSFERGETPQLPSGRPISVTSTAPSQDGRRLLYSTDPRETQSNVGKACARGDEEACKVYRTDPRDTQSELGKALGAGRL